MNICNNCYFLSFNSFKDHYITQYSNWRLHNFKKATQFSILYKLSRNSLQWLPAREITEKSTKEEMVYKIRHILYAGTLSHASILEFLSDADNILKR